MRNLIVGLARPLLRLLGRDERGGVAVLVAVLISGGVLLGIGALVIDVGQIYQNRAELQNGADASALAVAKSCIEGTCTPSIATQYADANASNLTSGTAGVYRVCGSPASLTGCPLSTGQITDCPTAAAGANYVDVYTYTLLPNGSHLLPPIFARTLAGNGSYQGSTVYACAQAEWGAPLTATGLGFTISACSWDVYTNLGQSFAAPPPYPPNPLPAASLDHMLKFHGQGSQAGCPPDEPSGADAPGNFGWTVDPSGNCTVTVTGNTYGVKTGTSASPACKTALANDYANKSIVYIPVYVSVTGTGATAMYTLKGFAAFVVTGYRLPGTSATDWLNPANNCSGNAFCIDGYFTQGLIPSVGGVGGPNLGAYVVKLTG